MPRRISSLARVGVDDQVGVLRGLDLQLQSIGAAGLVGDGELPLAELLIKGLLEQLGVVVGVDYHVSDASDDLKKKLGLDLEDAEKNKPATINTNKITRYVSKTTVGNHISGKTMMR